MVGREDAPPWTAPGWPPQVGLESDEGKSRYAAFALIGTSIASLATTIPSLMM